MPDDDFTPPDDFTPGGDQRAVPRFNLLIRPAKLLVVGEGEYLCVLRDVSPAGCKARIFHPLPADGAMILELGNGDRYAVERVWERDDHIGMRFCEPIPVEYLLNEDGRYRKRPVRIRMNLRALIVSGRDAIPAEIRDLSQQGAQMVCDAHLAVDQQVRLEISGLTPIIAKVRWRRSPAVGLVFEQTFRLDDFARLVAKLQTNASAGPDSRCA